jgi:hypothetical protein
MIRRLIDDGQQATCRDHFQAHCGKPFQPHELNFRTYLYQPALDHIVEENLVKDVGFFPDAS